MNNCRNWIEFMLPFLRVKREKAIEALNFIATAKGAKLTPIQINQIITLREKGWPIHKIGAEIGVMKSTVKVILEKHTNYSPIIKKKAML